jgi:nitrogen fixation-related uncharacterized protein
VSHFYESESPTRWFFGVWGWIIACIVMILVISAVLFGLGVVTAPWAGKGRAYQQQQSSNNRIFAQQQFQDLYNDYQATVAKIPTYIQLAKSGDTAATTNLAGLTSHCADVVGQYNAASGKYLTKDFRDANLPDQLDYNACKADRG